MPRGEESRFPGQESANSFLADSLLAASACAVPDHPTPGGAVNRPMHKRVQAIVTESGQISGSAQLAVDL